MQGAWASFAKDPYRGPGWNRIGASGSIPGVSLGVLGAFGSSGVNVIDPTMLDARCKIFEPVYAAETSGPSF